MFFPCFNEQENIRGVVERAVKALEGMGAEFEIIIVNDGSSDETGKIADEIAVSDKRIRAVHHSRNLGYGAALQTGFREAKKELVFFTDGDGQFDIGELAGFLPIIKECDIICGYRLNRQDPIIRKINGWLWTKLVCLLFWMRIRDIDCAFKLFRTEVFERIKMSSTGALISAEILAKAMNNGYRIREVGVHHYPRKAGKQTGAKAKVILRAFKELFSLYIRIRRGE